LPVSLAGRISEFWFLLEARLALLAGRRLRARSALKGVLRCNPNSFLAHFLLGRLYWRDHAVVKAKREFDLAWQIDPERFERAYARLRTLPERVPELFPYPTDEGVRVSARRRAKHYGDFVDEAERRHFESLPPITRDEILHIDWDRFQEEIQE
jgi:hypothetical protein